MNTSKPGWFAAIAQTRTALAKARAEYEAAGLRVLAAEARLRELEASAPLQEVPDSWRTSTPRLLTAVPPIGPWRPEIIKGGKT